MARYVCNSHKNVHLDVVSTLPDNNGDLACNGAAAEQTLIHFPVFPTACYHTAEVCCLAEACCRTVEACYPVAVLCPAVEVLYPAVVCAGMTVFVAAAFGLVAFGPVAYAGQAVSYSLFGYPALILYSPDYCFLSCTATGHSQSDQLQKASLPMMQMP